MSLRSLVPLFVAVFVLVGLAAVPAEAQSVTSNCQPSSSAVVGDLGFLFTAAGGGFDEPGTQSVCNAQCQDGSYVSCWGTSCSAVDANCPTQRGYCTGTATGTKYCPFCTCSATASCPDGSTVSCTGTGNTCFGFNGCYVSCNGRLTWCANPKGPCPVES